MANSINRTVTGFSAKKDSKNVPTLEVNLSKGKAQIKKTKTCGPAFLGGEQKLHKKFPSVSHHFGVKSGQRVGGISGMADYRSSIDMYR